MCNQLLFIGTSELLLIAALALLLFGGKKLPELMRGLGQGIKSFKQGMNDISADTPDPAEEKGQQTSIEASAEKASKTADTAKPDNE